MPVINQVGNALTGSTGTGAFVGATSPTITTPIIGQVNAPIGLPAFITSGTPALAVNYLNLYGNVTGGGAGIGVLGTDANINLVLTSTGEAAVIIGGTTTASSCVVFRSGAGGQHSTLFLCPFTAATRTITVPDADGTMMLTAAALTNGQIPIGVTGGIPAAATITAGTNITVTSASGAITISETNNLYAISFIMSRGLY